MPRVYIDSRCQSARTVFLSIRNVCITPNATLLFHAGDDLRTGRMNAASTQHMLAAYNSALRRYLTENHFIETFSLREHGETRRQYYRPHPG